MNGHVFRLCAALTITAVAVMGSAALSHMIEPSIGRVVDASAPSFRCVQAAYFFAECGIAGPLGDKLSTAEHFQILGAALPFLAFLLLIRNRTMLFVPILILAILAFGFVGFDLFTRIDSGRFVAFSDFAVRLNLALFTLLLFVMVTAYALQATTLKVVAYVSAGYVASILYVYSSHLFVLAVISLAYAGASVVSIWIFQVFIPFVLTVCLLVGGFVWSRDERAGGQDRQVAGRLRHARDGDIRDAA